MNKEANVFFLKTHFDHILAKTYDKENSHPFVNRDR